MIRTFTLALAAAMALGGLPALAAPSVQAPLAWGIGVETPSRHGADDAAGHRRHGEGAGHAKRGRGKDDGAGHMKRRPRTPGGSGCDSPRDLAEHPECKPAA